MATAENTQTEKQQDEVLSPKDIRGAVNYVYVNNSQVSASHVDVHIAFGEIIPTVGVQPRVGVIMSLHHSKAFIRALSSVIEEVEKKLGGIPVIKPETNPLGS